jgi:hypothetical protein
MKTVKVSVYTIIALGLIALGAQVFPRFGAHIETVSGFIFAIFAVALVWAECFYCALHPEHTQIYVPIITLSATYAAINVVISAAFIVCLIKGYTAIASYWQIAIELLLALGVGAHVIMTAHDQINTQKKDELNELYHEIYGEDYKD